MSWSSFATYSEVLINTAGLKTESLGRMKFMEIVAGTEEVHKRIADKKKEKDEQKWF